MICQQLAQRANVRLPDFVGLTGTVASQEVRYGISEKPLIFQCPRRELNPHDRLWSTDFKSPEETPQLQLNIELALHGDSAHATGAAHLISKASELRSQLAAARGGRE